MPHAGFRGKRLLGKGDGTQVERVSEGPSPVPDVSATPIAAPDAWTIKALFTPPRLFSKFLPLPALPHSLAGLTRRLRHQQAEEADGLPALAHADQQQGMREQQDAAGWRSEPVQLHGGESQGWPEDCTPHAPPNPSCSRTLSGAQPVGQALGALDALDTLMSASAGSSGTRERNCALQQGGWQQVQCGGEDAGGPQGQPEADAESELAAMLDQLAAVQHHVAQQAVQLHEFQAGACAMRERILQVQGQLSECEEQVLAAELLERDLQAAAKQERRQAAEKVARLQAALLQLTSAAAAERQELEDAAAASLRRARHLDAVAEEHLEAAATWKWRYELMLATHQPLDQQGSVAQHVQRTMHHHRA